MWLAFRHWLADFSFWCSIKLLWLSALKLLLPGMLRNHLGLLCRWNSSAKLRAWKNPEFHLFLGSLSVLFSFSWQTTCLGPCPSGKWNWKSKLPKRKSNCPRQWDSIFFRALQSIFEYHWTHNKKLEKLYNIYQARHNVLM